MICAIKHSLTGTDAAQPKSIVVPYLARIWSAIDNEWLSQLSLGDADEGSRPKYPLYFRIISYAMFGSPTRVRRSLDKAPVDDAGLRDLWTTSIANYVAKWQVLVQCFLGLMNLYALEFLNYSSGVS